MKFVTILLHKSPTTRITGKVKGKVTPVLNTKHDGYRVGVNIKIH